jgi:5-methylcytosine-specific restriction endonuclease McrA
LPDGGGFIGGQSFPALVLNADFRPLSYFPLSIWSWQDAVKAVFLDRVSVLNEYEAEVHSPTLTMRLPSVIALKEYIPSARRPAFTRFNVFLRDHFACQYCGDHRPTHDLTFDHVIPRSRGGQHVWDNVVAACRRCNHVKADRHVAELGWRLRHQPGPPSGLAWRIIGTGHRDPRWLPYLQPYGADDAMARIEGRSA